MLFDVTVERQKSETKRIVYVFRFLLAGIVVLKDSHALNSTYQQICLHH